MKLCDKSASHMLSMIAAIYGVFIYAIAFSLEMWFIITTPIYNYENYDHLSDEESIPVFAFVLAAIYFVTIVVSLLLMLGIIIKSIMCLMSWLVTVALTFLPECGLVLYMSIEKWGIESRNGQIELCLFIIRAIMNVFFMVCVQNLISQWKAEKQIASYAMSMSSYNCNPQADLYPFVDTNSTTINPVFKFNSPLNGIGGGHLPSSEFDTQNFQDLVKTRGDPGPTTSLYGQTSYSTQSLDRKKILKLQSTHSFKDEVILRPLHHHPFDYLMRPGSNMDMRSNQPNGHPYYQSKTLPRDFGDKNSSTHSIRDVAL